MLSDIDAELPILVNAYANFSLFGDYSFFVGALVYQTSSLHSQKEITPKKVLTYSSSLNAIF